MKTTTEDIKQLRARLAEAEETLRAIRTGEVDTVMVVGKQGPQVFTLKGVDEAYRVLIESMNEGALTLTAEGVILYANQCFARMVKHPLEKVTGSSFFRVLSSTDQAVLRAILKRPSTSGSKIDAMLRSSASGQTPVQLSIHSLARNSSTGATFGIVVTDMTEARYNEDMLRTLTQRVVQAQEEERGRVALELHDNITQHLCAVLAGWQAVANKLPRQEKATRGKVIELNETLGQAVDEVQRIARNLRPSVLDDLGLIPALRASCKEFDARTGVSVTLLCKAGIARLPAHAELALYRIFQKAFENVEHHSRASHVVVQLTSQDGIFQMTIKDDGIGFNPARSKRRHKEKRNMGLLRMRERAIAVDGTLTVKSAPRVGTEIVVRIPRQHEALATQGTDL